MSGDFVRVACPDCENEQVLFGKATTDVACAVCGNVLARPTGGNAAIEGEILERIARTPSA